MAARKTISGAEGLRGLLAALRAGSREAFDRLVGEFWEPVFLFFWKRLSSQDAEDLAQDVFVSIYRAIRNGQGPTGVELKDWRRYLFASARNALRSHWRRRGVEPPLGSLEDLFEDEGAWQDAIADAPGDAAVVDPLVSEEQGRALRDCLEGIDESSRAICWLHFAEGQSKRRIAAALGIPESSFRERLAHVLKDLRRCLQGKGMEPALN